MKAKLLKLMGVALTVVLLASLTVGLAGVPAGAASSNLKFVKLELPKVEDYGATYISYSTPILPAEFANSEGDFWCTPGIDLGPIAQTPDGGILFAAVADGFYLGSSWFHVLKSTDGGYSWTVTGFYDDAFTYYGDSSPIVDIVTSPEYSDDTTLAVATMAEVYISEDGGKNFTQLSSPWGGPINDLDITIAEDGDLSLMVATAEPEVYVTSGLLAWTEQDIATSLPGTTNVLACAFLPTFADDGDIGICAIVTDSVASTTTMTFSFADIADGGEWGDDIANAPFTEADSDTFESDFAQIAFPDDFDAFGIGNNVCFAGIVSDNGFGATSLDEDDGSDAYRVVCKEAGSSQAIDLDVRGVITTLLPTATAVTSIDVCGDAEEATILVGTDAINLGDTPVYFSAYISEDSGDSWTASAKCPTGGAEGNPDIEFYRVNTRVMMAPDFCDFGLAYASTWGYMTDAFQRTTDGGESWNQISIIDYSLQDIQGVVQPGYTVTAGGFNAYGFHSFGTLFMNTQTIDDQNDANPMNDVGTYGVLWGRMDGSHWERILSYATPGVTDTLKELDILMDGSAIFATDQMNGSIWRSTDLGFTFPKKISTKTPLMTVTAVSATTIYTGNVGEIWWSTRSGTGWTKPDDSEIPAGAAVLIVDVKEDSVLISTAVGKVFISSDGGETVEKVGSDDPFAGGPTLSLKDFGFANNGMIYATNVNNPGVMRCVVDVNNPGDAEWEQIDDNQDSTGEVYYDDTALRSACPAITLPPKGVLYIADGALVDTAPADELVGGLWRCANATDDTDSTTPPYFERENKGLNDGDMLGFLGPALAIPSMVPTFFFQNKTAPYYEQVVMFTDTLNSGVLLVTPEADAVGVGLLPENMVGDVYPVVQFGWEEKAGATGYQYQVSLDPEFKTKVLSEFTDDLGVIIDNWLLANATYYWRVRVADQGSLIGAPLISPWSDTYKFKTAIGPTMQRPALQAPDAGASDVPLSPTFEWSGIEWADTYEYELGLDPTTTAGGYFATPLVALVGTDALVSTAWKCDTTLDYETRYYWHVKAIGVDTDTPWSDVGTFTTMGVPPPPTTQVPPVEIPPVQQITPAWIWAIVIIGAILVIAVVVLIVTTRRVP